MTIRVLVAATAILMLTVAATKAPKPPKLPKGPGRDLVQAKCGTCHTLPVVVTQRKTREQWETSMDNMINRGMQATDEEFDVIAAYLAKNYAPGKK